MKEKNGESIRFGSPFIDSFQEIELNVWQR